MFATGVTYLSMSRQRLPGAGAPRDFPVNPESPASRSPAPPVQDGRRPVSRLASSGGVVVRVRADPPPLGRVVVGV
jgi:hypothetical protein